MKFTCVNSHGIGDVNKEWKSHILQIIVMMGRALLFLPTLSLNECGRIKSFHVNEAQGSKVS